MPPFGSAAHVNSFASTHTNTFIDTMSTTMSVGGQIDAMPWTSISLSCRPSQSSREGDPACARLLTWGPALGRLCLDRFGRSIATLQPLHSHSTRSAYVLDDNDADP